MYITFFCYVIYAKKKTKCEHNCKYKIEIGCTCVKTRTQKKTTYNTVHNDEGKEIYINIVLLFTK